MNSKFRFDSNRQSSIVNRQLKLLLGFVTLLCGVEIARAQKAWEYGGFLEQGGRIYYRRPNPSDTHAQAGARFQFWTKAAISNRLSWRGTWDFRLDTHHDVDRHRWLDVAQRGLRKPAGSLSEFYFDLRLNHLDLRLGKQTIRWGRADGFNPTDNLLPYDYVDTFSDERIAVPALKADAYWQNSRFELTYIPVFTPTRLPLLNQRWFPRLPGSGAFSLTPDAPPVEVDLAYRDGEREFPPSTWGSGQWGVRWNQLVPGAEFSLSYFDGFDDLAFFQPVAAFSPLPRPNLLVTLNREYYRVRVVGADLASELGPFGMRGELAYFDQTDPSNRDHLLFVIGLDRSWGDWFAIVQYAGQYLPGSSVPAAVFPDLGLRSTMLIRVERNLGPSRSLELQGAIRLLDGDFMVQPIYNIALSNRWRLKLGARFLAGPASGFLGQYRDSSSLDLQLRYTY